MKLEELNQTVMLIDTDFLIEKISENYNFYKDLYPEKIFGDINLAKLLHQFAINARVQEANHYVDIIFAYTLDNTILPNCKPNNVFEFNDTKNLRLKTNIGEFLIKSFFADENENCSDHFINLLSKVHNNINVSRIITVSDNPELDYYLNLFFKKGEKSFFLIKSSTESYISTKFTFVGIDELIAFAFGINATEL